MSSVSFRRLLNPMRSLGSRYYKISYQTKTNLEAAYTQTVAYIELSDEHLGQVSSTKSPAGIMIIIAHELVESVEEDSVIYIEHFSDEDLGLVVPERDSATYLQQLQSDIAQTPYTQTVACIELSDEDLGPVAEITSPAGMVIIADELVETGVPETNPAGMITIADKLVVDESQSEAYIEHLSSEDSELVSKIDSAGMITIAPEWASQWEIEADPENCKQVSTYIEDKRMEATDIQIPNPQTETSCQNVGALESGKVIEANTGSGINNGSTWCLYGSL
ncbi:hypothetical protein BGX38DRAFT_1328314 [Terfezia claveryi]|nr:hypothetical protein BGX38DRAFT_1328314 [Terfezia claveryi]